MYFTRHFWAFLLGRKFRLHTDHGSLTWLTNFKDPEGQLARWLEQLQEFDFDIVHGRGKKHTNADALSRQPCQQCGGESHESELNVSLVTLSTHNQQTRNAQLADQTIGFFLRAKKVGKKPSVENVKAKSHQTRRLLQMWDQLKVYEGTLYRQYEPPSAGTPSLQLVVPETMKEEVLRDLHEGVMGGHLGED